MNLGTAIAKSFDLSMIPGLKKPGKPPTQPLIVSGQQCYNHHHNSEWQRGSPEQALVGANVPDVDGVHAEEACDEREG